MKKFNYLPALILTGSRKGSRERNQYLENDLEWSRFLRDEEEGFLKRSNTSDTMDSRKGSSDSEKLFLDKTSRKGSGDSERTRQKDYRPKTSYDSNKKKYECRRKSLAVVERTRIWEHPKRRSSVSHAPDLKEAPPKITVTKLTAIEIKNGKEGIKKSVDKSILENFDCAAQDNRVSREFETSCWGLQNLKKDTTIFNQNPVILNNKLKSSLKKNVESEKSKSEDNLAIKSADKVRINVLGNNINVSKTDDSIEKQLSGDLEKKKKQNSNGHVSFFSKLRQLKDRMSSFGRELDICSEVSETLPEPDSCEKTGKSNSDNQNASKECEDDFEKSRTLPKTKKPHRTSGKMKKGWRALIGKSEGNSSSSLDVLPPPGSPSPVRSDSSRKTSMEDVKMRTKISESCCVDKKKSTWLSSPKKSGFLTKIGRSEEENHSRHTFLNNLTSSFRKRGNKTDEENGGSSSSSAQEGSKPN